MERQLKQSWQEECPAISAGDKTLPVGSFRTDDLLGDCTGQGGQQFDGARSSAELVECQALRLAALKHRGTSDT